MGVLVGGDGFGQAACFDDCAVEVAQFVAVAAFVQAAEGGFVFAVVVAHEVGDGFHDGFPWFVELMGRIIPKVKDKTILKVK